MKENKIARPEARACRAYAYSLRLIGLVCFAFCFTHLASGQCLLENRPFVAGENVEYVLYFKWGILMPKAGQVSIDYSKTNERNVPGYSYRLLFRTTGMFESVYKMRDTLACYFDENLILKRGEKRSNDGGYYSVDKLTFSYNKNQISAHSLRYNKSTVKIDTTLVAEGCCFDMIGSVMYLRSLDFEKMSVGDRFSFKVMIGRDIVNVGFHYKGQAILERDNAKYKTRYFSIDIYDEVFEHSESAAEIWIGDDANRIPVKIRAKLKLGAGEAYYVSSSGLRYPLTCRIEMPKSRR
jgi:hypothetical protein